MERILSENAKELALAGNSLITLESDATNKHFTYKIQRSVNDDNLYFIKTLRGPDNEKDYRYIGCYFSDTGTFVVEKTYKNMPSFDWPKSIQAIRYFLNYIDNLPDKLHVYHNGRCCRCGRILTTPESIKRGLGPECEKLV